MGYRRRVVRLLAVLAVFTSTPLAAQNGQAGQISARARDGATNRPHPSVQVTVTAAGVDRTGITSRSGVALISVPAGTYTVTFSALGFRDEVVDGVQVSAGETVSVQASLQPNPQQIGGFNITGSREIRKDTDAPATTDIIGIEEIESRPTTGAVEYLEGTVGVDLIKQGISSYNPVVRGFNNIFSGSLHALTDNRIAGIPSLRVNILHFVPANNDDLARMEVVLGPGSALYGPNTANGVLHMVTKSPLNDQGTTLSVSGGEREVFKGTFRTAHKVSDDFGIKFSGQYFRGQEWPFVDPAEVQARAFCNDNPMICQGVLVAQDPNATPSEIQTRFARIGVRDRSLERFGGEVRADWRVSDAGTLIFQSGLTSADGVELTGIGAGRTENWLYSYFQTRFSLNRFFTQFYVNQSDAGDSFLVRQGVPLTDKSRLFVGQIQHGFGFGDEIGTRNRVDLTYGVDLFRTIPKTEGDINGQYEDDDDVTEFGGYVQGELVLDEHWELLGALRADKSSLLDDPVFSPRAGILYKPTENHTFRATYNRAFSMPTTLNYFLDINGGLASGGAGQLGYFLRAQGTGREGISFARDDGQIAGVRSPFTPQELGGPGQLLPFDPATIQASFWPVVLGVLQQSGEVPPQILQILAQMGGTSLSLFDPATGAVTSAAGTDITDFDTPPLEESITNTFEIGYQGTFNGRVRVAADVFYTKRENFTSPLVARSPLVVFNGQEIAGGLIAAGVPAAVAGQIAEIAGSIPVAVVSSSDVVTNSADIVASYINFGELDYFGADLAIKANLNELWSVEGTLSWIEDDFFVVDSETDQEVDDVTEVDDINEVVSLNAPNFKWSAQLGFDDDVFSANGRIRHSSQFGANSADFVGLDCLPLSAEIRAETEVRDCIDAFTVFDVGFGLDLDQLGAPGAELHLDITNVFDKKYETFVGVPSIGRFALLQLRYTF